MTGLSDRLLFRSTYKIQIACQDKKTQPSQEARVLEPTQYKWVSRTQTDKQVHALQVTELITKSASTAAKSRHKLTKQLSNKLSGPTWIESTYVLLTSCHCDTPRKKRPSHRNEVKTESLVLSIVITNKTYQYHAHSNFESQRETQRNLIRNWRFSSTRDSGKIPPVRKT